MTAKDLAFRKISDLVTRFDEQYLSYKKSEYNETLTRRDFIDPFFKSLGWDIDNEQGYAEAYREVIHEDRVKVSGATKAPDYSFRLPGGKRLFFVEAKKPSVQVKDEIHPSYQVRRYGWSAKLPVSIITDFEEFSVYDCTKRPNQADRASVARINYLVYKDYARDFDFIWDTFSKEHVLKGSFDKFVQGEKNKKGTTTVDKEFLQSLDSWRTQLAIAISKSNRNLDEDELNYVVQNTIDRIIFLRIAEDRGIEEYGYLKNSLEGENYYENLFRTFVRADEKYNSGLFDFKKDKISRELAIDNKTIKKIIGELYFPDSPYEFSVLPVEILGNAYEQFLGKVICIDKSHKAKIEEKPEVRKAGGVYYTPQYIVDYIVKNTVGKLVEGKTPKEVSKLKIVDPACGSGSFLLGAYQYLLDWHKEYYSKSAPLSFRRGAGGEVITPAGNLATFEKKRILLNNIYGVDIDANAVEVTKLSLLLKCLEGETSATIEHQLSMFNERVLPTLDNNIKVGNSLIDTDFYSNQLDFGEEKRIKPFNWQKAFPDVFKQGGSDAVIGNPPYVQIGVLDTQCQEYLISRYEASADLYSLFVEKGIELLTIGKELGFIIPSLFIKGIRYQSLRTNVNRHSTSVSINELGDKVFEKVQMPTCIMTITKGKNEGNIDFFENKNLLLFRKSKVIDLGSISEIRRGLEIGRDKLKSSGSIECITGGDIGRYLIKGANFISQETINTFSKGRGIFKSPKIMVRETGNTFYSTIDYTDRITTRSIYNVRLTENKYSYEFILGIINSKLFDFYFHQFIAPETNIFPKIRIAQLREIPIPLNSEQLLADMISGIVSKVLILYERLITEKLDSRRVRYQSQIDYYEDRINKIVYELYGLTEEEIRIVEDGS